jgi:SAM-dependent methyltransferase
VSQSGEWEPEADNWLLWARTANHDAYWYYRDAFFDFLVPTPGCRCIEIGCGEGRVARDLAARGHRVTAVDSSPTLLRYARDADPAGAYALADGAGLPFGNCSFDLVVAYNSLQVVADMAATVAEAARVLVPGGFFCVVVSHPLADVGRFVDDTPGAAFAIREDYFANRRVDDKVERAGLEMTFLGWTYSAAGLRNSLRAGRIGDRGDARAPTFRSIRAIQPLGPGPDVPHGPGRETINPYGST